MNRVCVIAVALAVAAWPAVGPAQDPRLEPPRTPVEFWNAIEYELNTGQFEAAAAYLKGFLAANPTDKDFLTIERDRGMASFLRLRTVPQWSADPKVNAEAQQNAEQVVERASAAVKREVADPQLLRQPMQAFHAELQEPLVRALEELGEPRPDLMASAIESAVVHVSRSLRQPSGPVLAKDEVLALLHRMLGGALGVPSLAGAGQPHQPSR